MLWNTAAPPVLLDENARAIRSDIEGDAEVPGLPAHRRENARPAARMVEEDDFLDRPGASLRYSPSLSAAFAKPSGWRAAFRPKMSASSSVSRMIELMIGVAANEYTENSSAISGRPATSPTDATRHSP